jgi:hypothetical protein
MKSKRVRTTAVALRLRSRPEIADDSDTGLRLLSGQVAEAWGESFDREWIYLIAANGCGWVSGAHLEDVAAPTADRVAEGWERVRLREGMLPRSASNRPGTPLRPTSITIHNTANRSPGANAEMHRRYLAGGDARARKVSWHFTVDDSEAIQHLPRNEVGWHAGSAGNAVSLGIEICENTDGDLAKAEDRAALLTALLMVEENIPLSAVRTHKSWTGKDCPRVILQAPGGWQRFVGRIAEHFSRLG